MPGRKDIPPSQHRRDDGWLSDDQSAWYHEQPGALTPDQPTMPLASPDARPSFGSKLRDYYQPDEAAVAPPTEPRYQQPRTSRSAYQDRTSGYLKPREPRDAWEENTGRTGSPDPNRRRPAAGHSSKRRRGTRCKRKLPDFGGGLRGCRWGAFGHGRNV